MMVLVFSSSLCARGDMVCHIRGDMADMVCHIKPQPDDHGGIMVTLCKQKNPLKITVILL